MVFVLSVSELSKNRQRRYVVSFFTSDLQVAYKFHFGETCSHLVQATCVARDWGIGHAHVHHHTATQKDNNTQQVLLCYRTMADAPPPSSLGDKEIKICFKDDGREGRASSLRRLRRRGRVSESMCRSRHRPTDGGGLRSEGLTPAAGDWRGDRGIAAVVTAALVQ